MSYFDDNEGRIIYGRQYRRGHSTDKLLRSEKAPRCPYCNKRARLTDGTEVYPHRPDLRNKKFYLCAPCNAFVGCHPGTTKPLGDPANAALRSARLSAHRAFDPIWRDGSKSRTQAYKWLARELDIPAAKCHIGMFDEVTCERVVALCAADDFEVQE